MVRRFWLLMQRNIQMHNCLSKRLFSDKDFRVSECVILGDKSFHMKFQTNNEDIYFYIVSGCVTIYEFDIELIILNTSTIAPGQLLKVSTQKIKTILIESLGSFDEDVKFLKIERKLHVN